MICIVFLMALLHFFYEAWSSYLLMLGVFEADDSFILLSDIIYLYYNNVLFLLL